MNDITREVCNAMANKKDLRPCKELEYLPGTGTCIFHGGLSPNVVYKSLRRSALGDLAKINQIQEGTLVFSQNPFDALNQALADTHEFKDLIARMVQQMADSEESWRYTDKAGAEQLRSEITLYERALDRTIRAAAALSKLNIEERFLKLSEQQATSMMYILNEVFKRMGLDEEQRQTARDLVPVIIQEMLTQPGKKRYI